jgi:Spy/CpxP family protein refolding chaperone
MKTITKIALIGGLLASSIVLAAPSPDTDSKKASQGCHHGTHSRIMGQGVDGKWNFLDRMADPLKLTTEQRSSIEAVLQKSKSQMANLKERMQTNRKALREVRREGKTDSNQVQALAQERGDLVADLIIQRNKVRNEIQQVLTDTQREQMKQMREKREHQNKG